MFAALLLAAPSADAAAGKVTVSGKLKGGRGMDVLVLAPSGAAVRKPVGAGGRFTVKLRAGQAKGATLQLLSANGRYFGPLVLARKGKQLYSALSGRSAVLGTIKLGDGYARTVRAAPAKVLDRRRRTIGDRSGKPIGAGKLGLVRVPGAARLRPAGSTPQTGADTDRDGAPNGLDVDSNGNEVVDNFDRTAPQSAGLFSTLFTSLQQSLNVNAAGVTDAQIDALISSDNVFNLIYFFDDGYVRGRTVRSARVDCGTLSYCRRGGGTGIIGGLSESAPDLPRGTPWADYSPDGSGLPNLEKLSTRDGRTAYAMSIIPRATTAQLRPGDTYDVIFDTDRGLTHIPTKLSPYFVTTPALASYSSGGSETTVSYPASDQTPGSSESNPVALESGSLRMSFWRPQRQAIPGAESGDYVDIGHLHYGVIPAIRQPGNNQGAPEFGCKGFYSSLGGGLEEAPASNDPIASDLSPLVDSADDAKPDAANRLSFTLDVAGCLRAHGIEPSGQTVHLALTAAGEPRPGGQDRAAQTVIVKLPG